jgi:hypothetical protein
MLDCDVQLSDLDVTIQQLLICGAPVIEGRPLR